MDVKWTFLKRPVLSGSLISRNMSRISPEYCRFHVPMRVFQHNMLISRAHCVKRVILFRFFANIESLTYDAVNAGAEIRILQYFNILGQSRSSIICQVGHFETLVQGVRTILVEASPCFARVSV